MLLFPFTVFVDPPLHCAPNLRGDSGAGPILNASQRFQLFWFEENLKSRLR
jgi:hypothetical protein